MEKSKELMHPLEFLIKNRKFSLVRFTKMECPVPGEYMWDLELENESGEVIEYLADIDFYDALPSTYKKDLLEFIELLRPLKNWLVQNCTEPVGIYKWIVSDTPTHKVEDYTKDPPQAGYTFGISKPANQGTTTG